MTGCTSDRSSSADGSDRTAQTSSVQTSGTDRSRVEIPSLQLSLRLPESFSLVDERELLLLAGSTRPPAILSVAQESSDVVEHEAEDGETLSTVPIDGVEAVVVANASLDGSPPGIVSNELLVSNGERSFSLILSSGEQDLPALWTEILSSIAIT